MQLVGANGVHIGPVQTLKVAMSTGGAQALLVGTLPRVRSALAFITCQVKVATQQGCSKRRFCMQQLGASLRLEGHMGMRVSVTPLAPNAGGNATQHFAQTFSVCSRC